jgi:hypothetical protein
LLLSWLLLLEEYGVTFEYLPGKKNVATVADALSCLDINSLMIQEEEVLTILSGFENNNIINFPKVIKSHEDNKNSNNKSKSSSKYPFGVHQTYLQELKSCLMQ